MKVELGLGKLNIGFLADACGAQIVNGGGREFSGVCTDSREASRGTLFVALRGEKTDGHNFIKNVIDNGCDTVLCEQIPKEVRGSNCAFCVVGDTTEALSALGRKYKDLVPHKTVAVTGSVGKTTTKEYVSSVLSEKYKIYKTDGNHNSVIGMPMSMLELDESIEYAVLEMGMSGFGEIESMSRAAEPDIALITNIGSAHLEYLGTRENICRAKCEIVSGMSDGGILLVNADEPLLETAYGLLKNVYGVGIDNSDADVRAINIRQNDCGMSFDVLAFGKSYSDVRIGAIGKHHVYAALFALAVGILSGVNEEELCHGLSNYRTVGMRQNIYTLGDFTVIEDCYNASPESMRAGAEVLMSLAKSRGGRAFALLGDMRELGERSDKLHFEVGKYFAEQGLCRLFTYGESAERIADGAVEGGLEEAFVKRNENLAAPETSGIAILDAIQKNDVLLVKASRSVCAENVIEYIKAHL